MIERIVKLAELMVEKQEVVKRLEEELKEAKREMLALEREDLPQLMAEAGIQELKLRDGSTVTIKEDVDAKITDATRVQALGWLVEHGFGGLVKTQVSLAFARGAHDEACAVRDFLETKYDGVELKEEVHPGTLKAFVKERMAAGDNVPFDLFNIFPYSKATLKRGETR
jgi:hypothetical protein